MGIVKRPATSVFVAPCDSAFARDVMQLEVQAVHRVVRLFDEAEEFAVLVEPLRLKSLSASEQKTEHRLNQLAGRSRLLWGKWTDMVTLCTFTVSVSSASPRET